MSRGPRRQAFFTALRAFSTAQNAWKEQYGQEEQDLRNQLDLWYARICLLYDFDYSYYLPQTLGRLLTDLTMTPEDFYNAPYMDQVAQENRAEALVLLEPAVTLLKENFSSWDEAFENYVDG